MRKHRKNDRIPELTGNQAALARACARVGGQTALAKLIHTPKYRCSQSVIWDWLYRNKKGAPAERCAAIERVSGVPREELRPDIDWITQERSAVRETEAA